MTIYAVDLHQYTHTCPANPRRHVVGTASTIVHTTPGRPCTKPFTIRVGDTTAVIPCKRQEPVDRQCGGCRTTVTIQQVTTSHLGHDGPDEVPA